MPNIFPNAASERIAGPEPRPDVIAELLDVDAVASLLDCSARHVYRLADAGKMPPPVKLGALVRFSRRAVLDWIAGGCQTVRTNRGAGR